MARQVSLMKVVGIVAEYNPFHYGHAYQIAKAKEEFGQDTPIVAVMSGDFVQRGEPAITGKWNRTEAALRMGVDLVIELPFTFACASADRFSHGAISLLNATGIVTDLYFGSECTDLDFLQKIAQVTAEENPEYRALLKANLGEGMSYAEARESAIEAFFKNSGEPFDSSKLQEFLKSPNTILAIEYLAALIKTKSRIKPSLLERAGAAYHEQDIHAPLASASAIRNTVTKSLAMGLPDISLLASSLAGRMPSASLAPMLSEYSRGVRPVLPDDFLPEAVLLIRTRTEEDLSKIAYMGDHLSRRLKNAASDMRVPPDTGFSDAFHLACDTKRYARTRVNRALMSLLAGQTIKDLEELKNPAYIRILGFTDKGRYLLKLMRKYKELPLIDKASDFLEHGQNPLLTRMAELDLISSDLRGMKAGYPYGHEFDRTVIRMKGHKAVPGSDNTGGHPQGSQGSLCRPASD